MASFSFNRYLAKWQHRLLSMTGNTDLRDNIVRAEDSFVDFKLTDAQLSRIGTTGVLLIDPPGAGFMIVPTRLVTKVKAGATAYNLGAGTLDFRYGTINVDAATSGGPLVAQLSNAQVEVTANTSGYVAQVPASPLVPKLNLGIVVYGSEAMSAVPTDNNTTSGIFGRMFYRVVKITEVGTQP